MLVTAPAQSLGEIPSVGGMVRRTWKRRLIGAVMVHWIDNIAFGVDFRKNRKQKPETLEQVAAQIIDFRKHPEQRPETLEQMAMQIFDGINLPDTAPCEMIPYLATEEDLAWDRWPSQVYRPSLHAANFCQREDWSLGCRGRRALVSKEVLDSLPCRFRTNGRGFARHAAARTLPPFDGLIALRLARRATRALGALTRLARAEIRVTKGFNYRRQEMSLLSIIGWDVIGWENLTPQGIRFGIATILALLAVGRPGTSALEFFAGLIFILGAGLMVTQAVSLAHWLCPRWRGSLLGIESDHPTNGTRAGAREKTIWTTGG
jgi:hypothetical protein